MHTSARSRLSGFAVVAAVAAAACLTACGSSGGSGSGDASDGSQAGSQLQAQYERVVREVLPSVVQISTSDSAGSGVVYDNNGDIVTNEHVVGKATTVEVREAVGDHTEMAKVIGKYAPDDLAVVKIDGNPQHFRAAKFVSAGDTQIGEIVLAMGNPLGLTDSVTQGIISATGRDVGTGDSNSQPLITGAIQTSAAINPGNSGGALVNLDGQVVGIPTLAARLPDQGGAAPGIGFAIPSDTVESIAGQLIRSGKVTASNRASLGITAQTAEDSAGDPAGVAVLEVDPRSTAATAGLQAGDVITGINSKQVQTLEELELALSELKPGATVTIHYTRGMGGAEKTGSAKLGSLSS